MIIQENHAVEKLLDTALQCACGCPASQITWSWRHSGSLKRAKNTPPSNPRAYSTFINTPLVAVSWLVWTWSSSVQPSKRVKWFGNHRNAVFSKKYWTKGSVGGGHWRCHTTPSFDALDHYKNNYWLADLRCVSIKRQTMLKILLSFRNFLLLIRNGVWAPFDPERHRQAVYLPKYPQSF